MNDDLISKLFAPPKSPWEEAREGEVLYHQPSVASKRTPHDRPLKNRGVGARERACSAWTKLGIPSRSWRPEAPRLLVHKVTDNGVLQYLRAVKRFLGWRRVEREPLKNFEDVDRAGTWHMDYSAYEDRRAPQFGADLESGLGHLFPSLRGGPPNMSRALASW